MEAEPARLSLPAAEAAPLGEGDAAHIDGLRALFTQSPAILVGSFVGIVVLTATFWGTVDRGTVFAWATVATALWVGRLLHWRRFARAPDAENSVIMAWRTSWRVLVLAQAAMWGLAVWLFWGQQEPFRLLALVLVVFTYCVSAVQLLAPQPGMFLAFLCLVLVPAIVRIATDTAHAWSLPLAGLLCLQFGITWLMGRTYGNALGQAIRLKQRTDSLAEQLRREKAEADAARREAEAANRAKTQFFSAASHDLRQPLHAMGLFAEALRQRSHDPQVAPLVDSINESVDALEGLFSELLDITRIDTGGVDVYPTPVRVRDVFARLRLHFEPVAFEKGLQLSFRGERHVVHADAVLLDRMLRNLVSNALRYTDDGGVLVSCRRRGAALRLQVWDSGIGIAASALPQIFDEFYQVHAQRPLAPHQRKGLGLGLSIVQRLASLSGTEVQVRSRVGHGTVFSFDLPEGRLAALAQPLPGTAFAPIGLTLEGRHIVVVEDDPAVREGLVVALQAWGASVSAFGDLPALEGWLGTLDSPQADLAIVDYRLPDGANGLQALAMLRARWTGRRVPAIVVTGSTFGGHEEEAAAHDFNLLLKPVLPNKLRAMIAFKFGQR